MQLPYRATKCEEFFLTYGAIFVEIHAGKNGILSITEEKVLRHIVVDLIKTLGWLFNL